MTDIKKFLPKDSATVSAIYAAYKKAGDLEPARGYLGASSIRHSCERFLWYQFRACCRQEFDGRMYRLFATGDLEEPRFVQDLRDIGCEVHEVDENGEQFEVSALGGHFKGHMDGCVLGLPEAPKTWHVLEFKTHNAKSFAKLKKEGVRKSKPQHYAQCQVPMHLTGMRRALYLAKNKNTDELYAERIEYDIRLAEALMILAERIITSTEPPERISQREDWYECKWCDAKEICWGFPDSALPVPAINCRQCCHATPVMDGKARWVCERNKRGLSEGDQSRPCKDHLVLPGLISFAEPTEYGRGPSPFPESGNDWIEFTNQDGKKWRHGNGGFSTKELLTIPVSMLANPIIEKAKDLFGATVTGYCGNPILDRYPEEDSRTLWKGPLSGLEEAWLTIHQKPLGEYTPIETCEARDYRAAEFDHGVVVISWLWVKQKGSPDECEIREGVR